MSHSNQAYCTLYDGSTRLERQNNNYTDLHTQFFQAQSRELAAIKRKAEAIVTAHEETLQLIHEEAPLIADIAEVAQQTATKIHKAVDLSLANSAAHNEELNSRKATSAT
jgi:hypothetical protein